MNAWLKYLLTALASAVIGALITGFVALLTVGGSLHALETRFDLRTASIESRLSAVETSINYLREGVRNR